VVREREREAGEMDAITVLNAIISVVNFMLECRQVIEPTPLLSFTELPFLAPSDPPLRFIVPSQAISRVGSFFFVILITVW